MFQLPMSLQPSNIFNHISTYLTTHIPISSHIYLNPISANTGIVPIHQSPQSYYHLSFIILLRRINTLKYSIHLPASPNNLFIPSISLCAISKYAIRWPVKPCQSINRIWLWSVFIEKYLNSIYVIMANTITYPSQTLSNPITFFPLSQ